MRQFSTIFLLATATTVSAVVPHKFSSGKTAVAQDVNENFVAMDTAIQNRATKAELADKAAAKSLNDSAAAIRKAIPVVNVSGKADTSWTLAKVAAKADTGKVNQIASDVASLKASKFSLPADKTGYVRDEAGATNIVAKIPAVDISGLSAGLVGAQPVGDYWTNDTASMTGWNPLASETKVGGIRTSLIGGDWGGMFLYANRATSSNTQLDVAIDGDYYAQEGKSKVWHAGNLNTDQLFMQRGWVGPDWSSITTVGSYSVINGANYNGPAGAYEYGNLAVFGNENQITQMYFAHSGGIWVRSKWQTASDWYGWEQLWTSSNFDGTKVVMNTGGTITGDLRISGKLTTNPGATPADYVFEPDYKLAPLSEVEAYTKANKHLPEVPSAAEMTNNGVDLAAMNMVLLKKVEELTLHAIALQKDVEAQKAQMADQQKAMVEMKAYLELLRKN